MISDPPDSSGLAGLAGPPGPPGPRSEPTASGARRAVLVTLALFSLALALRVAHVLELEGTPFEDVRTMIRDCEYYDVRAREIAGGDLIGTTPGFLSPGYCFFVGAVYFVLGDAPLFVKLVQACLGAFSVALVYRAGRRVFSEAVGIAAALGLAFYGLLVYYESLLLPTTLVLFLHTLLLWMLAGRVPTRGRALAAGVVVGLAVGAKANALLLLPAIGLYVLLSGRERPLAKRAAALALFCLGAGVAIAPVTLRNYAVSGELVLVTTTGGRNLAKGNGPGADGSHTLLESRGVNIVDYLRGTVDVERAIREDRELSAETFAHMRADPGAALALFGRKLLLFFNGMELGIRDNFPFARGESVVLKLAFVSFSMLAPLGLVGLCLLAFSDRGSTLLALVLGTQVASFVLIFVLARYRVVAVAVLALFAAAAVVRVVGDLRARRFSRPLLASALAAVGLVLTGLSIEGFEEPSPPGEQHQRAGEWYFERERWNEARDHYELAAAASWRIEPDLGRLEARARVADCLEETGRPARARRLRQAVLDDVMRAYPVRNLELKRKLRTKLQEP